MLKGELKIRAGSAQGEFFTPESVGWLKVKMGNPQPWQKIGDPCCGSGRLLVLAAASLIQEHGHHVQETASDHPLGAGHRLVAPPPAFFFGQDLMPHGPAMGRISLTALGYLNAVFVVGDSLANPATEADIHGIQQQRTKDILAVQAGHLVTSDVPGRRMVSQPTLDQPGSAAAAPTIRKGRASAPRTGGAPRGKPGQAKLA